MKILLTSDTHLGLTKDKTIRKMFEKAAREEQPDVIVHAGDYCGGRDGYKGVRHTTKVMRQYFPDLPIVSVLGNHDLWCRHRNLHNAMQNYQRILDAFRESGVHFLDTDGNFQHPSFPHIWITGASGWYSGPSNVTNDMNFLPIGLEGDTWRYLQTQAFNMAQANLNTLQLNDSDTVVYLSHMPVIDDGTEGFRQYGGDPWIGEHLKAQYGCKYFLNGHAHQLRTGPIQYESGSDYYNPKYITIDII